MRPSIVRLILVYPLLAIAPSGCAARDDEAFVVAEDGTVAGTLDGSPQLLPQDGVPYAVNDGLPPTRDDSVPMEPTRATEPMQPIEPAEQCDPNYEPCVPIDSDVDCAGGRGNGPSYVRGPVRVVGSDIYELDRDGDGIGCDR